MMGEEVGLLSSAGMMFSVHSMRFMETQSICSND